MVPTSAGSRSVARRVVTSVLWQAAFGPLGPFAVALLLPSAASQVGLLTDPRIDVAVGAAAMLLAIAVTWSLMAWSAAVCAATIVSRLPGAAGVLARRVLMGITPTVLRRVVMTAAGVSVAAGLAACGTSAVQATGAEPASATMPLSVAGTAPPVPVRDRGADSGPLLSIDLDWPITAMPAQEPSAVAAAPAGPPPATDDGTPDVTGPSAAVALAVPPASSIGAGAPTGRVTESEPSSADPHPPVLRPADAPAGTVTVAPGDSLWSIAAEHLPPDTAATRIDASWREWYRVNREVIGGDPNVIRPGQTLLVPPTDTAARTSQEVLR